MRFVLILLPALVWAAEPAGHYLATARAFVDTMMAHGVDRYGPAQSPLFAGMLDLNTLALHKVDADAMLRPNTPQVKAVGFGLPDPPSGIRPGDRAPIGNNLEHDIMLLRSMYALSSITGEPAYKNHADSILRFWLMNCQSPVTGLMASGEHMSWNFLHEKAYGDVHEVYRRFPFFDELYAIEPYRALRIADGMWMAQIGNKKHGDFSRHAAYHSVKPSLGGAPDMGFPRHSGFYMWTYANAYAQSRDPKFIDRIEVLIESRTSVRLYPYSLILEPGEFRTVHSVDPALRILLWDAAGLVPSRKEPWRKVTRDLDERALADPRIAQHRRAIWEMGYGDSGVSGRGLEHYTRYLQTGDERFLRLAEQTADMYAETGWPSDTSKLWPRAAGQVISLLTALSSDSHVPGARQKAYRSFAIAVADKAIALFSKNKLFRADGSAAHYEAITGADDLLYSLLQLHSTLARPHAPLRHIDVNL